MDIARSSLKISLARAGGLILNFLGIVYFAQELGASSLGIFFLFQAALSVIALPANFGTRIAVEKRISEGGPAGKVLGTGITIKTVLLLIIIFAILKIDRFLTEYFGANLTIFLMIAIVLHESTGLILSVLKGELRVGETATLRFAYSFVWVFSGVWLINTGYGVLALVYGVILGKSVQLLWGIHKINTGIGLPSVYQVRSLIDYAKYSVIPEIDGEVHNWVDVLIIGLFISQAAVSAYEVAWRVAGPVLILTTAIGTTIFPQISSWKSENAVNSIERLLPRVITPSLIFVFPAFFGGALLSKEILGLTFGEEFTVAWAALIVLLAAKLPMAIRLIAGKSLLGLNRPDLVTHAAAVDIVANIVLNSVLIWEFGILGAAVGTTLAMLIGTVHRTYYLSKLVQIQVPYRQIGWSFISSISMFLILYILTILFEITTITRLLMIISAGAVIYGLFLMVYPPLRRDVIKQVQAVIR